MKFKDYYKKNKPITQKQLIDLIQFALNEIKEWEKFIRECKKKLK